MDTYFHDGPGEEGRALAFAYVRRGPAGMLLVRRGVIGNLGGVDQILKILLEPLMW